MIHKRVLIRVDGNSDIGFGHVSRCIALAEMIKDNFYIKFLIQPHDDKIIKTISHSGFDLIKLPVENNYEKEIDTLLPYIKIEDILVIDGYNFKEDYQIALKPYCHKVVCIDDIHSYHFYAHAVINHSEHSKYAKYSCEPYTKLYFGSDYILLRKPFLKNSGFIQKPQNEINRILICLGGGDVENHTLKIINSLELSNLSIKINAIVGPANPNYHLINNWINKHENSKLKIKLLSNLSADDMCAIMKKSDLIFTQPSTTAWEVCCLGIPMIIGIIAENQIKVAQSLENSEAAFNLGWYKDLTNDQINDSFLEFISNPDRLAASVIKQKKLIDGKSKDRFIELFSKLAN